MRGKCPELRKLPKTTRFSSINWRHQTPGSVIPFFPFNDQYYGSKQLLDPTHPSAKLKLSTFPVFRSNELGGKIYPVARLYKPNGSSVDSRPFLTWTQRVRKAREAGFSATLVGRTPKLLKRDQLSGKPRPYGDDEGQVYPTDDRDTFLVTGRRSIKSGSLFELALKKAAFRIPMSYKTATSKKRMGASAYMRRDITRRVKVALSLTMTRGAYVDAVQPSSGKVKPRLKFNVEDIGRKWSMQGWTYIFYPNTEVYGMPYHQLVPKIRQLLEFLNSQAVRMENSWMASSLLTERGKSSVNAEFQQICGRTNIQDDQLGMNENQRYPDSGQKSMKGHDLTPANQSLHNKPPLDRTVQTPHTTKPYKPAPKPPATAAKPHSTWKAELMAGMVLLSQQISKNLLPKTAPSKCPPKSV